jgi:hypothetical protein
VYSTEGGGRKGEREGKSGGMEVITSTCLASLLTLITNHSAAQVCRNRIQALFSNALFNYSPSPIHAAMLLGKHT